MVFGEGEGRGLDEVGKGGQAAKGATQGGGPRELLKSLIFTELCPRKTSIKVQGTECEHRSTEAFP